MGFTPLMGKITINHQSYLYDFEVVTCLALISINMTQIKSELMKTTLLTQMFKPLTALNKKVLSLSVGLFLYAISFAGSGGGKLEFKNASLVSGTAGANGAVYRFPQVNSDLDALVKIKGRSNALVNLVKIDNTASGFDKAWQPLVGYNNGSAPGAVDWWMEFEITLVQKGTSTAYSIDEFDLTAIDIDGNGDKIREYVSFYGLNSYTTETNSVLRITNIFGLINNINGILGTRFDGPTTNYNNIDTSGTTVMTTAKYLTTSTFTIRTGAVASGANGAADRMYSLYFQKFVYNQPAQATLPVTLKSFNTKLVSSKVVLDWACSSEVNFSHFVVERSTDGKNYHEVTMIFNDTHTVDYTYTYSENVNENASGLYYYRLKMVDNDGKFEYSQIRIVKLNQKGSQVAISTYPNPVSSELRITIPSHWQNQPVSYDMITVSGVVVKHKMNERASQTETMQVNDVKSGTYIIRLKSGTESAAQLVVKK